MSITDTLPLIRQPSVAGRFYPADAQALGQAVDGFRLRQVGRRMARLTQGDVEVTLKMDVDEPKS